MYINDYPKDGERCCKGCSTPTKIRVPENEYEFHDSFGKSHLCIYCRTAADEWEITEAMKKSLRDALLK
jgi:hypothetical protein